VSSTEMHKLTLQNISLQLKLVASGASSSELLERLRRDPETLEAFVNHGSSRVFQSIIDLFCGFYLIT
jgi:ABC-type multidrug transport system fused ATPase/permease subunit